MNGLRTSLKLHRDRQRLRREMGESLYDSVKRLKIVAFPNRLHEGYALGKCLALLGLQAEQFDSWSRADLVVHWQDQTVNAIDTQQYISLFGSQWRGGEIPPGINYFCKDISKSVVGAAHDSAFGYALDVDPTVHVGPMVEKSDANATHDGRVVHGPLPPRDVQPGKIYSVLVNNTHEQDAVDCRLIFMGGELLSFYYEKRRPIGARFSNDNASVTLRHTAEYFSGKEMESIRQVCQFLKADYGEMDVLRDADNGRVYVVDFAKTPVGPPNGLPRPSAEKAIRAMALRFAINILAPLAKAGSANAY